MKFEYLKGSEKDFTGAPEWAEVKTRTAVGEFWLQKHSLGGLSQLIGHESTVEISSFPYKEEIIAERRPITEPVWDGNFPISPGTLVDVHFQSDDSRFWTEFRVEYMRGDVVVLYDFRSDSVESYSNELLSFRPVRSPEDVARDEAIDDLVETMIYFYGNPKGTESYRGLAVRIIEAIKIGKIPGVKLE